MHTSKGEVGDAVLTTVDDAQEEWIGVTIARWLIVIALVLVAEVAIAAGVYIYS